MVAVSSLFISGYSYGQEQILSFNSTITINSNSQLNVHETIVIAMPAGRHGLLRDFPTHYKNERGIKYTVNCDVTAVNQNGKPVPYTVSSVANGKCITIGDPDKLLPAGTYTYEIMYTTNRHIGFFEDHDELYWNVTGCGWPMRIENASAQVTLPYDIPANKITLDAYTGHYGYTGNDSTATLAGHTATWETNRPLFAHEGLTIVISWPKGYITPPSLIAKLWYGIQDNLELLWILLCLLIITLYSLIVWIKVRREHADGVIIPLFYPPKNFGPAHARYLLRFGYDHKAFAAEIINMAVHGFITIENKKTFNDPLYILKKTHKGDETMRPYYQAFLDILFAQSDTIEINGAHESVVATAINVLKNRLSIANDRYFNHHSIHVTFIMSVIISMVIGFCVINIDGPFELLCIATGFAILLGVLFYYGVRGYTSTGKKLRDEVEGFKLYLATAEAERLEIVGTPPTRTPELFEKYLPYAVALDVEKQWTQQFAPIFAQQSAPFDAGYAPVWYYGTPFRSHNFAATLSKSLSSSINSAISSSGVIPGSSSGLGGCGSSGGGSGGGGGRTW